jgi:glycosyltransferase involved in cell wall biosynthesis
MRLCIVIPVYNHEGAVPGVLESLKPHGLHCVLVNDGSSHECREVLHSQAQKHGAWVSLVHLEQNQGKGGAVMAGIREARIRDFTHALQIDADGQHEAGDLPLFIEAARRQPDAVICGVPVYDQSAPKARLYGRWATHVWIWINSLSFQIKDAMCGFRLYPVHAVHSLMDEVALGRRMDFDPEVLVRLSWRGTRIVSIPTNVQYPKDGRSHFRLFNDNWLISRMHARLFFGMLFRSPLLLWRKWNPSTGPASPKSALPGA